MIVKRFFGFLKEDYPIGTTELISRHIYNHIIRVSFLRKFLSPFIRPLNFFHDYFDNNFDRKYGTNTSGIIPIKELKIESRNIELANWYEPISVKIFTMAMNTLAINYQEFVFIDYGSGKGRALLMASRYGFKRIIGIEFARDLHQIAMLNIEIFKKHQTQASNIECIYGDAENFVIPNEPLVFFFYEPFKGNVMLRVLNNISRSFTMNPRKIIIIFYGNDPETLVLMKSLNFN